MAAIRSSNIARPVSRTCCFHNGILTMKFVDAHNRSSCDAYRCEEIPSSVGRDFRLTKIIENSVAIANGETYTCSLSGDGWQMCGCLGNQHYSKCRHTAAIRNLVNEGRIGAVGFPGSEEV